MNQALEFDHLGSENLREAPILDHLEELRWRLVWALGLWAVGSGVAYTFREQIMFFLRGPLEGFIKEGHKVEVVTLTVTEPLTTVFQISMFGGFVLALPFIAYQIWAFVSPGLTRAERRWGAPFVLSLGLSFGIGAAFAYFVILPYAVPFLLGFLPGTTAFLSVGEYITQMVSYLAIFGIVFELPIVMFLLTKVGLVNHTSLSRIRKPALMVIVLASAIITPTADPINLALMAVPLYFLFEIGILLSRLAGRGATAEVE